MPKIYLSPSTQEYNPYVTGNGSEEYFMNLVADAMEPYLLANGIQFSPEHPGYDRRVTPSARQTAGTTTSIWPCTPTPPVAAVRDRSGASSPSIIPPAANGRRAAEIIARNLQEIYPLPERVVTRSTTSLGEVRQPRAPAVLVEIGYHDNEADARWIESHIDAIAPEPGA